MSGCDYLKNLKGIGFRTIMSIFEKRGYKKNITSLLLRKGFCEDEIKIYMREVELTTLGFKYPLIYDKTGNLSYINQEKLKTEEVEFGMLTYYVGEKFDDYKRFVEGKLNIKTLKLRDQNSINYKRICEFLDFVPDSSLGRLNNLCSNLLTYDNFDAIQLSEKTSDDECSRKNFESNFASKRIKRDGLCSGEM